MVKLTHSRKRRSKSQRSRSTRIIHVAIRPFETPLSKKNNTSINYHGGCSINDKTKTQSVNDHSSHLSTMKTNFHSCHTSFLNDPIWRPAQTEIKDTCANPTDYAKKKQNINKKKKCRTYRFLIMLFIGLILLIAVMTILLVMLLPKSKPKTTYSGDLPVLRWNRTGITIAGITGQCGNGSNQLCYPYGLDIDWSYTLYIADRSNNRIQKYLKGTSFGQTVAGQASGANGTGPSFLYGPTDVIVDSDENVYALDTYNCRVQLWNEGSSTGVTIAGMTGSFYTLNYPYGIAQHSTPNTFYVADTYNHRIISYITGNSNGTLVAGGNGQGLNGNQLDVTTELHFDAGSNSLLIANCGANNTVRWTLGASNWTLIAGYPNGTTSTSSTGLGSCARGITSDPMGNIYIADSSNKRIQFYPVGATSGTTIAGTTSLYGTNASLLSFPVSVVLDNQLNIYVSDYNNHRVQKFMRY